MSDELEADWHQKVESDSPDRCQSNSAKGQCVMRRQTGSQFCEAHSGNKTQSAKAALSRQYDVARWRASIDKFAGHESVKSLREEVGIIRLLLETTLNLCHDEIDLVLYSPRISDLVLQTRGLVKDCHKLESSMGMLLDRAAAMQLSNETVEIVGKHVKDEKIIEAIAKDLMDALVRIEELGNQAEQ